MPISVWSVGKCLIIIGTEGLLDSALDRCKNKAGYEIDSTVCDLAAALAFGIARNYPFHDGNKRVALIASFLFAELNGVRMTVTEVDGAASFLALAAGGLSEADLAKRFKAHSRPRIASSSMLSDSRSFCTADSFSARPNSIP